MSEAGRESGRERGDSGRESREVWVSSNERERERRFREREREAILGEFE